MASNSTLVGVQRDVLSDRQRVSITPTASIPRIQFSSGAARALQQFGADMFSVSQRMEDRLDQQAQGEATVEGATAGLSSEFELRDYTTIRNRAFNQAGIQTFVATLETRGITATAEIRQRFANDPSGMQAALLQYHNGVASEINKISPGAGAMYRQRSAVRSQPAIENARDSAFRLTKDQAEAMLITSERALSLELKSHAADLFSVNPALSKSASSAVGMVGAELMKVYDAVDPVTGRPLFSAVERANAKAEFNATVFKTATLSWFSAQEDQVAAYLQFVGGDFKIDLDLTGPDFDKMPGNVATAITKAAAKHGVDPDALATIAWLESGFRPGEKNPDSSAGGLFQQIDENAEQFGVEDRFDPAQSADGAAASMAENKDALTKVLGREPSIGELYLAHQQGMGGAANLLTNPDALAVDIVGSDEVKLNDGTDTMTAQQFANKWIRRADNVAEKQSIDLRKALNPAALRALDAEMRSQISFSNRQVDREVRIASLALEQEQAETRFDFSVRLFSGPKVDSQVITPLTPASVIEAVESRRLSSTDGDAFLKAINVENSTQSDLTVYDEALRRIAEGADITTFVLENKNNLSNVHTAQLIQENRRALDDPEERTMTEEQRGYLSMLKATIAPDALLGVLDSGASLRSFNAQDEYRQRISEGEAAPDVARDIIERAGREGVALEAKKLQKLLTPRFSVPGEVPGTIDPRASAEALEAARQGNMISEESYQRQKKLILQWMRIQKGLN